MSEFKYVMFEDGTGRKTPVIFPGTLVHADVAKALMRGRVFGKEIAMPVNAGMLQMIATQILGDSETLQLKPGPLDRQIINTHNYTGGVESGLEPGIERMLMIRTAQLIVDVEGR